LKLQTGRGAYGETKKAGDSPAQLGNRGATLILQCRTCGKTGGQPCAS